MFLPSKHIGQPENLERKAFKGLDCLVNGIGSTRQAGLQVVSLQARSGSLWVVAEKTLRRGRAVYRIGSCSAVCSNIPPGFPSASGKDSACNAENQGVIPGSGRLPWRRKWQPFLVFFPGESHVQKSLANSMGVTKESDTTEVTYHARVTFLNSGGTFLIFP